MCLFVSISHLSDLSINLLQKCKSAEDLLVLRFEHKNTADRITDMGESVVTPGYSHVMGQFSHVNIHLLSISSTIENI